MLDEDPRWHSKTVLHQPELCDLLERWRGWAQSGMLPLRAQFDPMEFPRVLPWMVLAEVLAAPPGFDARMRYIGSEIVHYFDSRNLTGARVSDLEPIYARRWSDVCEKVITARAPLFFEGRPFMVDKAFVLFEMLALPLSKGGQTVDFVVLALARSG